MNRLSRYIPVALPISGAVVLLGLWWTLTAVMGIPSYLLPSPGSVASRLASNPSLYVEHARYTLEKIVIGGGIGVITGVFFGTLIYFVSLARVVAMPYIITIRVLPKIAIAPLLLIYFGTGMGTAVFLVALIAFFPMVVNTAAGLQQAPQRHRELLKSVDTGSLQLFYSLYIPYALPDVFAGLKQSVTLAVVGAILAEWIVIDNGLGHIILLGSSNLQADLMIAALLVLTALGLSVYAVVVLVQQQIFWTDPENLLESH